MTEPMFEQTFKNIDDILHKDAGAASELEALRLMETYAAKPKPVRGGRD